jgi:hypothetical protein
LTPISKGDGARLLIQTAPPLDNKYGWYRETVERWVIKWDIEPKTFWKQFGVNTAMVDNWGKIVFYQDDVVGTLRELIDPKFKRVWD